MMNYYDYICQRQAALHDRHATSADFTDAGDEAADSVDIASSRFSGGGGSRYLGLGLLHAHRARTSNFAVAGQHQLAALANGEMQDYGQDVDAALKYDGGRQRTPTTPTNHRHRQQQDESTCTATPLHAHHHQLPHRLRYLPPPAGTVLPPLDNDNNNNNDNDDDDDDDDGVASVHGEGRSSASSTGGSSTSDCSRNMHAAERGRNGDVEQQQTMNTDRGRDSTTTSVNDNNKTSTDTTSAAAAAGSTSTEPLIYPWMRRVHSSNSGMHATQFYDVWHAVYSPHRGLLPCRGGGAYAPMTRTIFNLKERS